ncbi:MAG: 3-deoxy-7-phosphoheptulonate synthase [Gemmatimonadaceae bacterium]|nr:3-deoxy-7-phosphoheptulonate synthase [Gemmatimonadaceae bacterium]
MIIITEFGIPQETLDALREHLERHGVRTHVSRGTDRVVVGCIGDTSVLDAGAVRRRPGVASVVPVRTPYRLASREFRADSTRVPIGDAAGTAIGGRRVIVAAGPCSVESADQLTATARGVRERGAAMLRGGAFKPRTSPWAFQGLGAHGLALLAEARAHTGLPVVTEVMDTRHVDLVAEHADMLQIGARNMQNYALLAEVGRVRRPVLLKRGLAGTITELLLAAEHILARGNEQVVLCERGIRTYETATRNTFDVAAIPVLKRETHLPVFVDPSHAAGRSDLVAPLAFAAVAAGADGLIVEVHPNPGEALSDGDQSLTLEAFGALMQSLEPFAQAAGRTLAPDARSARVA